MAMKYLKKVNAKLQFLNVMLCAIWYHFYNLKNMKDTRGRVLLLVKLQVETCNFTKSNTLPWVFFTFFKLCKWYQIGQRTTYRQNEFLNPKLHRLLSNSLIQPHFDYACISWYSLVTKKIRKKIQVTQNKCTVSA